MIKWPGSLAGRVYHDKRFIEYPTFSSKGFEPHTSDIITAHSN